MGTESPAPSVAVVVVNYDGGDLTLACLASLQTQDHPADRRRIILVDNASSDGVAARVRDQWPDVDVVEAGANLGFAGGVNLGVEHAGDVDYVALLNPDATADPGWLHALVTCAEEAGEKVGAVNAKVVFDVPFRDVRFGAPVRIDGARQTEGDVWNRLQFVEGWLGPAYDQRAAYQWSDGPALLRVPDGPPVELRVDGSWQLADGGEPRPIINSVGVELTPDLFGADRGYLEVDEGQYDERAEVFAWTGSAVLLRKAYLDDVGPLDASLFLYYEDLDHAWRGRARGWRYLCEPRAVARHVHQGATGASPRTELLIDRNRLIVLARHASRGQTLEAVGRHLLVTASYARRDVVRRLIHGDRPSFVIVGRRLRALAGALRAMAIRR